MTSEHQHRELEARAVQLLDERLAEDDGLQTSEEIARGILRDLAGDDAELRDQLAAAIIAFDRKLSGGDVEPLELD